MDKVEFIKLLDEQAELYKREWHWERTYANSDDTWSWVKQGVDCRNDIMELKEDNVVIRDYSYTSSAMLYDEVVVFMKQFYEFHYGR
jgi:hypothetical protein